MYMVWEKMINKKGLKENARDDSQKMYIYNCVGKHILYIDANKINGWAMSQYLAIGYFEILSFSDDNIVTIVVNMGIL